MMPPVDLWQLYRREVSLVTSYSATPEGLARAMAILSRDDYALEKTISHRFPIADAQEGFTLLHEMRAAKVVVTA
jgi:L-iditol 2-dehydrogenase